MPLQVDFVALPVVTEGLQGFSLLVPANGDTLLTTRPSLFWQSARVSDPADTIRYVLYWSEDPDFLAADSAAAGPDTAHTFPPGLLQVDHRYYWKIRAFDQTGYSCWSAPSGGWSFYIQRDEGTPVAPALAAEESGGNVLLTCSIPLDLSVQEFRVYRRTEGAEWVAISPALRVDGNRVSFLDAEAEPGVLYEYEVELLGPLGSAGRWGPVSFGLDAISDLQFRLAPNPGRSDVGLLFSLPLPGDVALKVYDAAGREMTRQLWSGLKAGSHARPWSARDRTGRALPAGTYWLRLDTPAGSKAIRWTLVR